MIETREQWEDLKKYAVTFARIQYNDGFVDFVETIEALREVAKAAQALRDNTTMEAWNEVVDLERALATLPDWITENENL